MDCVLHTYFMRNTTMRYMTNMYLLLVYGHIVHLIKGITKVNTLYHVDGALGVPHMKGYCDI